MPALAYAALIRIVRSLEESELYPHEVDILRGAADARLLADLDREERMLEAEELLGWLVESERVESEVAILLREQLHAIHAPAVPTTCPHVPLPPAQKRPEGSLWRRAVRALFFGPAGPPPAQPKPAPAQTAKPAKVQGELLDDEMLAALAELDQLEAEAERAESLDAVDAAGRPFDADRLTEQAENLLAFHVWLEENGRR